jgi:hypothetical protein
MNEKTVLFHSFRPNGGSTASDSVCRKTAPSSVSLARALPGPLDQAPALEPLRVRPELSLSAAYLGFSALPNRLFAGVPLAVSLPFRASDLTKDGSLHFRWSTQT